jgi:putative alpha-1,2-mannosidase
VYIQSATLNNKSFNQPWLYHSTLIKGGKLTLVMGNKPNVKWGSKLEIAPPSMTDDK